MFMISFEVSLFRLFDLLDKYSYSLEPPSNTSGKAHSRLRQGKYVIKLTTVNVFIYIC